MPVPERIMGTEVEYAIIDAVSGKQPEFSSDTVGRPLPVESTNAYGVPKIGQFLANGGRLYKDIGDHVEYATPESAGPLEATLHEIAGEYIVRETVAQLEARMNDRRKEVGGEPVRLLTNKRLCNDSSKRGDQAGSHHSFQIPASLFKGMFGGLEGTSNGQFARDLLSTHLAASSIFTGAGTYRENGDFYLSQKRWAVTEAFSSNTTSIKALINSRDERHESFGSKNARLHVVSGEAAMNPWSTWMQLGTLSILLRVCEGGWQPSSALLLAKPGLEAAIIAKDPSLGAVHELANGKEATAAEIEYSLAQIAVEAKNQGLLSEEEELVADNWLHITEAILADQVDDNLGFIDWAMRRHVIENQVRREEERTGVATAEPAEQRHDEDLMYDRLGPEGLGYMCRRRGLFALRFSDTEIEEAIHTPPQTTRARTRGEIISNISRVQSLGVDWGKIRIGDEKAHDLGGADRYRPRLVDKIVAASQPTPAKTLRRWL